ncbi:translation initiation factor IF-2-like [Catharus ustulatus]|uniref:translation initiation factor IF-2-like n=1 Tax=Catharus ustulatus TaxID=91951 RepID=UPI00140D6029|nr:translation initiation factor IF-2-like [Catharus ustulatus]
MLAVLRTVTSQLKRCFSAGCLPAVRIAHPAPGTGSAGPDSDPRPQPGTDSDPRPQPGTDNRRRPPAPAWASTSGRGSPAPVRASTDSRRGPAAPARPAPPGGDPRNQPGTDSRRGPSAPARPVPPGGDPRNQPGTDSRWGPPAPAGPAPPGGDPRLQPHPAPHGGDSRLQPGPAPPGGDPQLLARPAPPGTAPRPQPSPAPQPGPAHLAAVSLGSGRRSAQSGFGTLPSHSSSSSSEPGEEARCYGFGISRSILPLVPDRAEHGERSRSCSGEHPSGRCSAEGRHGRCSHRSRAGVRSIFRKHLQLGKGVGAPAVTSPLLSPCPQSCGLSINHHLHKFALNDQNESWCFPGYKVGVTLPLQQPPESPSCSATDCTTFIPPLCTLQFSRSSAAHLNSDVQINASVAVRYLNMCRTESRFCERGQCLTVGNHRAQCNSGLISAVLPKTCCDTNHHPPGHTFLKLEESL